MKELKLEVKQLDPNMPAISYAHEGDAGLDLRSTQDVAIPANSRATVACGIALAIPRGYAGLVVARSGLASRHGIGIVNAPGLIDSGYRGEIKVILHNTDGHADFTVRRGDRIAQLVIIEVPTVSLSYVEDLSSTQRGEDGFGSSGVS